MMNAAGSARNAARAKARRSDRLLAEFYEAKAARLAAARQTSTEDRTGDDPES